MLLVIPDLLSPEQTRQCRDALAQADWVDGRGTAGHAALKAKHNLQLAADHPLARQLGDLILEALTASPVFMSAALPLRVLPPRFNRYEGGGNYGFHIDNSVMNVPGAALRIRTDISSTLFFSDPDEYDGGELVIQDTYGEQRIKLPAGDLVVYPGTSLHQVTPVTRGARLASFFWTQSLVRDDAQRSLLYQMDRAIQSLTAKGGSDDEVSTLIGVYHNLLRQWSET
ncbi:MAG: Fe2+-dependent dioxygenase [Luteimonas sp.]|nr:Fe2+-dependent dioxygenase [Luteimonas sp.]